MMNLWGPTGIVWTGMVGNWDVLEMQLSRAPIALSLDSLDVKILDVGSFLFRPD